MGAAVGARFFRSDGAPIRKAAKTGKPQKAINNDRMTGSLDVCRPTLALDTDMPISPATQRGSHIDIELKTLI
jgi:hypothetical protein